MHGDIKFWYCKMHEDGIFLILKLGGTPSNEQ
jgi:hypothetical protein